MTVNANRTDWASKIDNALWAYQKAFMTPILKDRGAIHGRLHGSST